MRYLLIIASICITSMVFISGCDTVLPGDPGTMVIEAYLDVGKPLPKISVRLAAPLSSSRFQSQAEVTDASVQLSIGGTTHEYVYSGLNDGFYIPAGDPLVTVPSGTVYSLRVERGEQVATASGITPLAATIKDVLISVGEKPVAAVLLDSLDLGLDSLNISLNTRTGFIYPIQVQIDWLNTDESATAWIETRLDPITPFSSTIVDFFLLPTAIFPETSAALNDSTRRWEGVYAVPVDEETDPLPVHELRVALLRSNDVFAQYASSKLDPTGREPITNLTGAVGFVGGVSIDSIRVSIPHQ